MPNPLIVLPRAQADIDEQSAYLTEQESPDTAGRFLQELDTAFARLRRFPLLGRQWLTRNPNLAGLRRLPLTTFPLSLFYQPTEKTIEIIRVLHHSRQLPPELQP